MHAVSAVNEGWHIPQTFIVDVALEEGELVGGCVVQSNYADFLSLHVSSREAWLAAVLIEWQHRGQTPCRHPSLALANALVQWIKGPTKDKCVGVANVEDTA